MPDLLYDIICDLIPEYKIETNNRVYSIRSNSRTLGIIQEDKLELLCMNLLTGTVDSISLSDKNFDIKIVQLINQWKTSVDNWYDQFLTSTSNRYNEPH